MSAAPATDFNDLMIERGNAAVREAIDSALAPESKKPGLMSRVDLLCASNIQCVPIRWLWGGHIAKGKFHILGGAPGTGKTTIAMAIAAAVSSGGAWPDGSAAPAGNVLIWSGEDDPADTLVPRLKVAGADLDRIFFITGTREDGEVRPFDPAKDLTLLQFEAEQRGDIALIVVDPVVTAITGDSHNNTEVRRGLQPLVDIGVRLDAAIIGITHFSKGSAGRDPTERVVGSVAFGALARVVLVTAKVQKDGEEHPQRIMARSKSNIGPDGGGFTYALEQVEFDGISASRVSWGEALLGTARELLTEDEPDRDARMSGAPEALRELLASGPRPAKEVVAEAREAGYSRDAMFRARKKIGVVSKKLAGTMKGGWLWSLPGTQDCGQDCEGSAINLPQSSQSSQSSNGTELVEI